MTLTLSVSQVIRVRRPKKDKNNTYTETFFVSEVTVSTFWDSNLGWTYQKSFRRKVRNRRTRGQEREGVEGGGSVHNSEIFITKKDILLLVLYIEYSNSVPILCYFYTFHGPCHTVYVFTFFIVLIVGGT